MGFTFLELLICLAIIAILAAMILPVLNRGDRSPSVACLSNQRQIVIAATLYQNDQNGIFPNLDFASGNDGPVGLSLLTSYTGNRTNLFMCPLVVRQREKERPWYRDRFNPVFDANFFRSNGNDYAYYDGVLTNSYTNALIADRLAWTNAQPTNFGIKLICMGELPWDSLTGMGRSSTQTESSEQTTRLHGQLFKTPFAGHLSVAAA